VEIRETVQEIFVPAGVLRVLKKSRDVTNQTYHKSARLRLIFTTGLDLAMTVRIRESFSSEIAHVRTSPVPDKN
jgi:hypothetical protein